MTREDPRERALRGAIRRIEKASWYGALTPHEIGLIEKAWSAGIRYEQRRRKAAR
jgi:hypothetical protein